MGKENDTGSQCGTPALVDAVARDAKLPPLVIKYSEIISSSFPFSFFGFFFFPKGCYKYNFSFLFFNFLKTAGTRHIHF